MPARCPAPSKTINHGDFGAADHVMVPETTSMAAATIEARKKLPDACASKPGDDRADDLAEAE